jgi:hypothetical protein
MVQRSGLRYRTAILSGIGLFACSIGITLVQSFQSSICNNLQTATLRGTSVQPSSSSSSPPSASPMQNFHQQRPLGFRSLVLVGDYETRPYQLPDAVPQQDVSNPTRHTSNEKGEMTLPSPSLTISIHKKKLNIKSSNWKRLKRDGKASSSSSSSSSGASQEVTSTAVFNNRHSSGDWLYNLRTIPHSSVLNEIRNPVLILAGWATSIAILHRGLMQSPNHVIWASNMCIPPAAHSFLVSSLGLLLVFRTNSAYQRFLVRTCKMTHNIF